MSKSKTIMYHTITNSDVVLTVVALHIFTAMYANRSKCRAALKSRRKKCMLYIGGSHQAVPFLRKLFNRGALLNVATCVKNVYFRMFWPLAMLHPITAGVCLVKV